MNSPHQMTPLLPAGPSGWTPKNPDGDDVQYEHRHGVPVNQPSSRPAYAIFRAEGSQAEAQRKKANPPRPPNPFILFRNDYTRKHARGGPKIRRNAHSGPLEDSHSKRAGQAWRALTAEEKQPWQHLAKKAGEEHAKMYPDYRYRPNKRPPPVLYVAIIVCRLRSAGRRATSARTPSLRAVFLPTLTMIVRRRRHHLRPLRARLLRCSCSQRRALYTGGRRLSPPHTHRYHLLSSKVKARTFRQSGGQGLFTRVTRSTLRFPSRSLYLPTSPTTSNTIIPPIRRATSQSTTTLLKHYIYMPGPTAASSPLPSASSSLAGWNGEPIPEQMQCAQPSQWSPESPIICGSYSSQPQDASWNGLYPMQTDIVMLDQNYGAFSAYSPSDMEVVSY
ncbi:hypothetical protein CPB85DRAFT_619444 [Mucidula mucida]|nr:hypothetical protein CPB85DRAFT_619444 [Mucidula mucida]